MYFYLYQIIETGQIVRGPYPSSWLCFSPIFIEYKTYSETVGTVYCLTPKSKQLAHWQRSGECKGLEFLSIYDMELYKGEYK